MMLRLLILSALILAGCESSPPREVIRTVKVQVVKPCIDNAPERPHYRFGGGPAPSAPEMEKILAEDFEAAEQYGIAWEAAAAGCLKEPVTGGDDAP